MNNPLNSHTKMIVDSIREELATILSDDSITASIDNPIEFENDFGKFKYEGGGRLSVQPKKGIEYIVLNTEILPTSDTQLRKESLDVNFKGDRLCKQIGCPNNSNEFSNYCAECYEEKYI